MVLGIRKKVMLDNLLQAFPAMDIGQRKNIARRCARHFGMMTAEFARMPILDNRYLEKYVEFDSGDAVSDAQSMGKGGLVISGHFGNWELMGGGSSLLGYPVTYIVASQSNPLVDKLLDDYRRNLGIEILKLKTAAKGALKSLKQNRFIAILIDQDAGKEGEFVDFFGKPASTHRGAAIFHLRTGAPLIFASCIRIKGPYYRVKYEKVELKLSEGSYEQQIREITQRLTKILEDKIKMHLEQWFWMHKRWKRKPKGD